MNFSRYIAVPSKQVTHAHSNLETLNRITASIDDVYLYYKGDKIILESQMDVNLSDLQSNYDQVFSRLTTLDSRYYRHQNLIENLESRIDNTSDWADPILMSKFSMATDPQGVSTLLWDGRNIFEKSETTSRPYQIETYALAKAFKTLLKKHMIENLVTSPTGAGLTNVKYADNGLIFNATPADAVYISPRYYLKGGMDNNESPTKYFISLYPYISYLQVHTSLDGGNTWTPYTNETTLSVNKVPNASIMIKITLPKILSNVSGARTLYGYFILHN